MLKYLKDEANKTYTENGALSNRSTMSDCLDLFSVIGAKRDASEREIIDIFQRAYIENADYAMKILFFARDIRGGLGERRTFRIILRWLAINYPKSVIKNIELISEYGRFDDLLVLIGTPCQTYVVSVIQKQLESDKNAMKNNNNVSLLAKWLPSVNTSNKETVKNAKILSRSLRMTGAEYRKTLAALRKYISIIENNLREKNYSDIDYSKQPSKAMFKYRKAFLRNDEKRYSNFLQSVSKGKTKLNAGTLMPYEIIRPILEQNLSEDEREAIDITWNSQKSFSNEENALVVIDGSGSMYNRYFSVRPAEVALSLGIYFAERCRGPFHNHFITFSTRPRLVEIKGDNICDKVKYCEQFNEISNTDIKAVFELILRTAIKYHLPQSELPSTLYIISDLEFDTMTKHSNLTNFEYAKKIFAINGYTLPNVVFWNVRARHSQYPVTQNEQGVSLVSGCSPQIFSMAVSGEVTPYSFMMNVIQGERYASIRA